MQSYTVIIRAVTDHHEQFIHFEAASRDEALFEAGRFTGAHYHEPWELVRIVTGFE